MSLSQKLFGRKISLSKLFGLSRNENGRVENSIEKPKRKILQNIRINRNWRKRPKVDASFFDSALSHTRRSDASEKKREENSVSTFGRFACGQVSSPRLYRLNLLKFCKIKYVFLIKQKLNVLVQTQLYFSSCSKVRKTKCCEWNTFYENFEKPSQS